MVTSDIPTIREVSGGAAVLVDPNSLEHVVRGVKEAMERKEELSMKGLERSKNFSLDVYKLKLKRFYEDVINSG